MKETEILNKAIQQFTEITGVGVSILHNQLNNNVKEKIAATVEFRMDTQVTRFFVEIKNELREQNLPNILQKINKNAAEWLLVCKYIPKPIKENLKKNGVNYLETAGNCSIKKDNIFFYINNRNVTALRQPKEGKLWKNAGLKFLFGILINPELINQPYRQIAIETNIALGNIGPFIEELKQEGFLKKGVKNHQSWLFIDNKDQLQNKWIELFNAVLKPKLKQGRYKFIHKTDLQNWNNHAHTFPNTFYWGGEPAAALLTGYLQPEKFTIYTKAPIVEIMKQLRLVPDKNGIVQMMDIFWKTPMLNFLDDGTDTVPPLLAYAELISSLDSRNRETAERIKQQYLDKTN